MVQTVGVAAAGAAHIGATVVRRKPSESYMSPEMARRYFLGAVDAGRIELRAAESADVWMLGAVMFELLSGVQVISHSSAAE